MLIFLLAIGVALGVRALHPPRQQAIGRLRWVWMPVGAAALQISLNITQLRNDLGADRFVFVIASYVLVGVWIIANASIQEPQLRAPASLIAGGWILNVIPIIGNHGMPVSRWALSYIGGSLSHVSDGNLWKHVLATSQTFASWLGDVIPIPIPVVKNVISIGDVVMLAGAVWAIPLVRVVRRQEAPIEREEKVAATL